jgi:hypothetical protein
MQSIVRQISEKEPSLFDWCLCRLMNSIPIATLHLKSYFRFKPRDGPCNSIKSESKLEVGPADIIPVAWVPEVSGA